jgi:alpha-1,2-mannosyltransferase
VTGLATDSSREDEAGPVEGNGPVVGSTRWQRLRSYLGSPANWGSPAGLVIASATILALALRVFIFTQSSFLTSGTVEYDDGVYLGAAIRLLQGALPYKDYAFVQPPGVLVIALPSAVIAKLSTATAALAAARIATACVGAACVALAGNLVRHRGVLVTVVTCGLLAVYPADIMASRTLLLEPWMNLFCLLAATAAFSHGRLASPRRLGWAGLALGFATTIKFWAALPAAVLLAVILLVPAQRWARARWYALTVAGGFVVPVAAFAGSAPGRFLRDTLLYQATRQGTSTPMALRLDHLTGLSAVLTNTGINVAPGSYTLFQATGTATMEPTTVSLALPLVVALVLAALIIVPYARWRRDRSHLEWFALVTAAGACAAILSYSAFFYHYPAFPAPWLAIASGAAAGAVAQAVAARRAARAARAGGAGISEASGANGRAQRRRRLVPAVCVAIAAVALIELVQLNGVWITGNPSIASVIPPGACVVSDQVAVTIAADRFTAAAPGCPDVVDSLAQTLAFSHGESPAGGAGRHAYVQKDWESVLGKAQYVWLTGGSSARIPWRGQLRVWFQANFHQVAVQPHYDGSVVYERNG